MDRFKVCRSRVKTVEATKREVGHRFARSLTQDLMMNKINGALERIEESSKSSEVKDEMRIK